jgi:hypothetical protein
MLFWAAALCVFILTTHTHQAQQGTQAGRPDSALREAPGNPSAVPSAKVRGPGAP